jgi:hypothetical protein
MECDDLNCELTCFSAANDELKKWGTTLDNRSNRIELRNGLIRLSLRSGVTGEE